MRLLYITLSLTLVACGGTQEGGLEGTESGENSLKTIFEKDTSELLRAPKCEEVNAILFSIEEKIGDPDGEKRKNEGELIKKCHNNGYLYELYTYKVEVKQSTGYGEDGSSETYESVSEIKEGKYLKYYENGNLEMIGSYLDDTKNGKWTVYRKNGKKASEGEFNSGRQVGEWNYYDEDGFWYKKKNFDK